MSIGWIVVGIFICLHFSSILWLLIWVLFRWFYFFVISLPFLWNSIPNLFFWGSLIGQSLVDSNPVNHFYLSDSCREHTVQSYFPAILSMILLLDWISVAWKLGDSIFHFANDILQKRLLIASQKLKELNWAHWKFTLHYVQFVKYIFPRNRTTSN